jgi:hypothetical protein
MTPYLQGGGEHRVLGQHHWHHNLLKEVGIGGVGPLRGGRLQQIGGAERVQLELQEGRLHGLEVVGTHVADADQNQLQVGLASLGHDGGGVAGYLFTCGINCRCVCKCAEVCVRVCTCVLVCVSVWV